MSKSTTDSSRLAPHFECIRSRPPGDVHLLRPPAFPRAPPVEHVAWRLRKGTHCVEARLRHHPLGIELWCLYDGAPLWSEIFRHRQPAVDLDRAIDDTRCAWEQKGWRRAPK